MSGKYKPGDDAIAHFVTFTVFNWIDALTRSEYKDIIVDSLRYCSENKGMKLHAWVIMSNHVHLIMSTSGDQKISFLMRDLKKFTSKMIFPAIRDNPRESRAAWMIWMFERAGKRNSNNTDFQFWQEGYHPVELSTPAMLRQRLNYLHENPVRAGIVFEPQDYVYSSGIDYYTGRKGKIAVELL